MNRWHHFAADLSVCQLGLGRHHGGLALPGLGLLILQAQRWCIPLVAGCWLACWDYPGGRFSDDGTPRPVGAQLTLCSADLSYGLAGLALCRLKLGVDAIVV